MGNLIRPNKSTQTPHNLMFVDTETYPVDVSTDGRMMKHRLRLGVAISAQYEKGDMTRQHIEIFKTTSSFWRFVISRTRMTSPLWIFSHNAGFDSTICGLWNEVDESRLKLHYAVTENPPTLIRFSNISGMVQWVDSMNWFRESIASIGESIGLPKLTMPEQEESEISWANYCERDAMILMEAIRQLLNFHTENDLGVFKTTAASQAFQTWRHRFAPMQEIDVKMDTANGGSVRVKQKVCKVEPHLVTCVKTLERDAYHQGISWMNFYGKVLGILDLQALRKTGRKIDASKYRFGPIHVLDVNSLYPFAMASRQYPTRLLGFSFSPTVEQLAEKLVDKCVIANVLLDINYGFYPARLDGKVGFYKGHFWTSLTTGELAFLYSQGRIKQVSMMAWYEKGDIFDNFVDFFYEKRLEYRRLGNKTFDKLAKLYMNALYGKFAQKQGEWVTAGDDLPLVKWGEWSAIEEESNRLRHYRGLGNLSQVKGDELDLPHTFTAIPAHVTAYGRMHMDFLMQIAGRENVHYCNVDSLHCNHNGYLRLLDKGFVNQEELGMLKYEGEYDSADYRGIRNYSLGDKDIVAGLNSTCKKVKDLEFECLDFQRLDSVVSSAPHPEIVITKETKRIGPTFHDGIVHPDGRTEMYRLETWDTKSIVDLFSNSEKMTSKPTAQERE